MRHVGETMHMRRSSSVKHDLLNIGGSLVAVLALSGMMAACNGDVSHFCQQQPNNPLCTILNQTGSGGLGGWGGDHGSGGGHTTCHCAHQDHDPVCGMDGVTYPNACEADCATMDIDFAGACPTCDGMQCPPLQHCELKDVQCVHAPCPPVPTCVSSCFCPTVYHPVCGADGHTYSNACFALCAMVAVSHTGECTPPPTH